ncbi:MAG TPA: helix-turn-helix transcriptional regulator [Longimicrobiaceae bacterium]|nr:helix-turn-helix transcriptional regulator [Longimicrobiaceae bacterium]
MPKKIAARGREKLPITKHGTLGWLAKRCFIEGRDRMREELDAALGADAIRDYHVVRPGDASRVLRTDMRSDDQSIDYEDFSPPDLWGVPYAILSVDVQSEEKDYYMYHGGEELLVPVSHGIQYRFFWTLGGTVPAVHEASVVPGQAIRINPQIPHHGWGLRGKSARAWMVMRHSSDSAAALNSRTAHVRSPRTATADELSNPAHYALVAWGLAEGIRLHRDRAGLGVKELANLCGIDAAQLSRMESVTGSTNVSLDAVISVASYLRLPIAELVDQAFWNCEVRSLPTVSRTGRPRFEPVFEDGDRHPHRLHTRYLRLGDGDRFSPEQQLLEGNAASWIVLKGRVIVEMDTPAGRRPEVVDAGAVIHFRKSFPSEVEARGDSEILQVKHAAHCDC